MSEKPPAHACTERAPLCHSCDMPAVEGVWEEFVFESPVHAETVMTDGGDKL